MTVAGLFTPLVSPMYCVRLFCDVFVSVQSLKYEQDVAIECTYGIAGSPNPAPPTPDQLRFSNEKTTMCW